MKSQTAEAGRAGAGQGAACHRCGTGNPAAARFCMTCGSGLDHAEPPSQDLRFVTVVFCDVVGSTELAARLDAEVWAAVMEGYFAEVGAALDAGGGRLEKFIGDAVVGVFGTDAGLEGDASRAVTAAREALDRIAGSAHRFQRHGVRLSARVGIASGRTVAANRNSSFAVGAVMNRAARLQSAAPEGGIVLDLTTWLLVRDEIACRQIEPVAAKGFGKPLRAWLAGDEPVAAARAGTRFVNQDRIRTDLTERIHQRLRAPGTSVFHLTGEAGIGKTRLLHMLCSELRRDHDCRVLELNGPRHGDRLSLWPLYQLDEKLTALERESGTPPEPAGQRVAQSADDLQWILRRRLARLSAPRPLVLALDDFPRAGTPLRAVVEQLDAKGGRIVALLTSRGPESPEVRGEHRVTVPALDRRHARDLVDSVTAGLGVPGPVPGADEIVRRGQGNPLFLEQLGALAADGIDEVVAPSAEAVLGARIDRLSPDARKVLACAGAWAREVSLPDLAATCDVDHDGFDAAAAELAAAGLLPVGRAPQRSGERFAADVAYARIPLAEQARVHGRIAERWQALAGHRPDAVEPAAVHAELAHSARERLDPGSAPERAAARRAAGCLCSAARFTVSRSQVSRALELAVRARRLCGDDGALRLDAGAVETYALAAAGRTGEALALIDELASAFAAEVNLPAAAHLRMTELTIRSALGGWDDGLLSTARDLTERAGEDGGRARLHLIQGLHVARSGDYARAERSLRSAYEVNARATAPFGTADIHGNLALCMAYGNTPAGEALEECAALVEETAGAPMLRAAVSCPAAFLDALTGDVATAERRLGAAEDLLAGIGHKAGVAGAREFRSMVAELAGDEAGAVRAAEAAEALYRDIGFEDAARRCRWRRILLALDFASAGGFRDDSTGALSWHDEVLALQVTALREAAAGRAGAAAGQVDRALRRLRRINGHGAVLLPLRGCLRVARSLGGGAGPARTRDAAERAVLEAMSAKS